MTVQKKEDKSLGAFLQNPWLLQAISIAIILGSVYLGYLAAMSTITTELCSVRKTLAVLINIHSEEDPEMMRIYGPLLKQKEDICSGLR